MTASRTAKFLLLGVDRNCRSDIIAAKAEALLRMLGVDRNCRSDIIGDEVEIWFEELGVDRNCRSDIIDRVVNSVKTGLANSFTTKIPPKQELFEAEKSRKFSVLEKGVGWIFQFSPFFMKKIF